MSKTLFLVLMVVATTAVAQKKRANQVTLPKIDVVDIPVVEWSSYPQDTTMVGLNIQTFSSLVKSRLPLRRIEVKINGLTTDVYAPEDFSSAVGKNKYEQLIERTVPLRTGSNIILIVAENDRGIKKGKPSTGSRRPKPNIIIAQ